jgi:ATP synthase alpha/beta family, nucleotide-binding domain
MVGTVSPAGGNFDEPVTQSTLGTVKTFLGLSSARAYKRFYPAVDPPISWSRYLDQLRPYFDQHLQPGWTDAVRDLSQLLHQGESIYQMMQVTGEEGITLADYVTYQKSLFLDMVYLQQDAYDKVDVSVPLDRQKESFALLRRLIQRDYPFADKEEAHRFFTQLTGLLKKSELHSPKRPLGGRLSSLRASKDTESLRRREKSFQTPDAHSDGRTLMVNRSDPALPKSVASQVPRGRQTDSGTKRAEIPAQRRCQVAVGER